MMNRTQVESVLKINGIPLNSPEEKITSVLLGARYTEDEVNHALAVLRGTAKPQKSQINGLHKIFRTDDVLKPYEISKLLGIHVDVDKMPNKNEKSRKLTPIYLTFVILCSLLVAACGVLLYMYMYHFGPFHPTVGLVLFNEL